MSPDKKREPVRTDEQPLTLDGMQRLTPTGFEEFVKRMFETLGYAVETTAQTGDEGVDLVLTRDGERSIAQCKRYRGQVGQPTIRDFYGTVVHEKAKRGYLVTSGRFSLPAQAWAEGKNVTLVDGPDLLESARISQTSLQGLDVSAEGSQTRDDRCRICNGELVRASIGMGSVSGVGQPKTNATLCRDCKAVYELITKSTLTRRERGSHFHSCEDKGLEHNLRVTAIRYDGDDIKALVCRKCKSVFDFNGNRAKALTEVIRSEWFTKIQSTAEEFQGRRASTTDSRLALYESGLGALTEVEDGFIVFQWKEREECFVQFAWQMPEGLLQFHGEVSSRCVTEEMQGTLLGRGFSEPDNFSPNYYREFAEPQARALAELVEAVFVDVFGCPLSYTVEVVAVSDD